ncbi:MAG: alpha-glucan family phosphorylase, partial [Calditrichia bacterium]|nr:alpha-glucan family phosphorylase [Calditrichia bacterium]
MEFIGEFNVLPQLPKALNRLNELSKNFYFCWHKDTQDIFREINPELWRTCNHNPVKFLRSVSQKRLEEVGNDTDYLQKLDDVLYEYDKYINTDSTWFNIKHPEHKKNLVAYFSAEYGFHESLPIYSGGLGILAGDHCKAASDLGLPMVGIGLAYHQAYFTQKIDASGKQHAEYPHYNFHEMPLTLEKNKNDKPLIITINLAGEKVNAQIWRAQIGRIPVYLLDTNISSNSKIARALTSKLYGGDQEMRISQEILLGIGGVKAVRALGYKPDAWHMNEGHSVFLGLRRIYEYVKQEGLNFHQAKEAVAANNIFTTHTPVPAGNDAFPLTLKEKFFRDYWESVKIKRHEFMELGTEVQPAGYQIFSLTILAFNIARFSNGVSKLHQQISRKLWESVWPDIPEHELPIDFVTNGVHAFSWIGREMGDLFYKYLGKEWIRKLWDHEFWDKLDEIPMEKIWETKRALKVKMIQHFHRRMKEQYERNGMGVLQTRNIANSLN